MQTQTRKFPLVLALAIGAGAATLLPALAVRAQPLATNNSWLDQPLSNWNRPTTDFPRLPRPVAATNLDQCRETLRQPTQPAEFALTRRGWNLFGPVQSFGTVQLIMATSGFDGMCRPMGYQAFVYVEGRYAGTLSPVLMDSRSDGALSNARLISPTAINAEFLRYTSTDARCCPTRTSVVNYRVRADEVPDLLPISVSTQTNCQANRSENSPSDQNRADLTSGRWQLTALGNQPLNSGNLFIEFDAPSGRFSGSSGCNRFMGSFEGTGEMLRLSPIASTRRACLDPAAQQIETEYWQALELVTRFEIQGNRLRLYQNNRLVLQFRR